MKLTRLKNLVVGSPPNFRALALAGTSLAEPEQWLVDAFKPPTKSGVSIGTLDSLRSTAVLTCVRILSESIAQLPLVVLQNLNEGGKRKAPDHYLYPILHYQVNPFLTSFEWRELMMQHLTLWGNHYCEIERNRGGLPIALWPLRPDMMRVVAEGMELKYYYTPPDNIEQEIREENVLHVKGLSTNGYIGQSLIGFAREAVGLGVAMEDFTGRFFSNDATPRTFITHPMRLSPKSRGNLEESFEKKHKGLENKFRMQILEEGMGIETVGMPLEDAQFMELRKFELEEVLRIFRIQAHKGGVLDRATFSNIEHQGIEFVTDTLMPWIRRIESAFQRDLFFSRELGEYYTKFIVEGLLRGDIKTRYEAYAIARQWGWHNLDEIRELEDMNPIPGGLGQEYIMPMNFQPIGSPPQIQEPRIGLRVKPNGHDTENGKTYLTIEDLSEGHNER